ncbi:hypothetical protein AGR5A_Cc180053 [Agrobacterium genomosp. 5 str. CFBP 6626]|nr:hypothetical protein AGR5A_Cc180053 [Agrobacterium genomosp. 5 str. CFBP 6626]
MKRLVSAQGLGLVGFRLKAGMTGEACHGHIAAPPAKMLALARFLAHSSFVRCPPFMAGESGIR